jgi:hypothetical protein
MSRTTALSLLCFALPFNTWAAQPPVDPWQAARNLDFDSAAKRLDQLGDAQPADLRITVARAASLLARQPRTEANVREARAILDRASASTGPAAEADLRALAAYLVARIDQDHLDTPDLAAARTGYSALRREYPAHPLADQAALQLAYILAYQTPGTTPAESVAGIEALLGSVGLDAPRRELHLLLARILVRELKNDAAALPHLAAARAIGCLTAHRDYELDLMIATIAARLGQGPLASRHYLAFADARPRDVRAPTARRLAAEAVSGTALP